MRRARILFVALLCLPLTACFDEPIHEHLHLTIRIDGSVAATVVQEVASSERAQDNQELAERLEESRETLAQNLDPWSQRLAVLEPLAEHQSAERVEGELRRSIHSAVFASFDDVVRLVEADGLTGNLVEAGGESVLQLFPTGGSRATYFQRQDADRLRGQWSVELATYFTAAVDLYAYLDQQPDPDVLLFAAQPRHYSSPPTSGEVESAILAELVPQDLLQLRWRFPRQEETELDLPSENWLEVMADAEAHVPY